MNATLTATEMTLIKMALNYPTREDQLSDNYSNLGLVEASKEIGISITDTIKTLNNSNFFSVEDRDDVKGRCANYPTHAIVYITEEAVNAYFDYMDAKAEAEAEAEVESLSTLDEIKFSLFLVCSESNFNNSLWASNSIMYKRDSSVLIAFETTETYLTMTILDTTTDTKDRYTVFSGMDNTKQVAHLKEAIRFSAK